MWRIKYFIKRIKMIIGKFSDIGTFGDIGNENISAKNRKLCKFFDDIETPL